VRLVVHNTGWLPSYVTKRAQTNKLARGIVAEIELPPGASLETGRPREQAGQLEGRAYKPASPSSWGGWSGDTTEDRAKFEWVVRAQAGSVVKLSARHERAGRVSAQVRLAG
jgi:hypothetical protein